MNEKLLEFFNVCTQFYWECLDEKERWEKNNYDKAEEQIRSILSGEVDEKIVEKHRENICDKLCPNGLFYTEEEKYVIRQILKAFFKEAVGG